jgi:hypothetical protein
VREPVSIAKRLGRIIAGHIGDLKEKRVHSGSGPGTGDTTFDPGPATESVSTQSDPREAGYIANLELGPDASMAQIRGAYRKLLKKYHPDLHASDRAKRGVAGEITRKLNEGMDYFENKYGQGDSR